MQEKNENNTRSQNGWYKHSETGQIVQLIDDPDFGVPLTNAYIKAGFVFVSEEDPRKEVVEAEVAPPAPTKEIQKEVK